LYRPRCEALKAAIDSTFPAETVRSNPEGGMFLWVECPPQVDTLAMYKPALERNVTYVPGRFFFTEEGAGLSTMRLNFTCHDENEITKAASILAELATEAIEQHTQ
jgi:2-aminoadipate transaminase